MSTIVNLQEVRLVNPHLPDVDRTVTARVYADGAVVLTLVDALSHDGEAVRQDVVPLPAEAVRALLRAVAPGQVLVDAEALADMGSYVEACDPDEWDGEDGARVRRWREAGLL